MSEKKTVKDEKDVSSIFEEALSGKREEDYLLVLYVSGMTRRSEEAIENIKAVCDKNLRGRCKLSIVDIYQQPEKIKEDQIFAAPTLVKRLPLPFKKLIGDLNDEEKILVGLGIKKK